MAAGARVVDARGEDAAQRRGGAVRRRHVHLADARLAWWRHGHGRLRSRPRPAPEDAPPAARKPRHQGGKGGARDQRNNDETELVPAPPPPATAPGDVTGKERVDLADRAIAHLEKAIALRPHYADAMTYLALVWRQKIVRAVCRAGRLAAGGRSRERVAEARAGRAGREELTMAFEAFRAQAAPARAGRKRLWYAISIGFHGALIAAGVVYSFWHIEELSPPLLKVTFLSAAPPPPPAAPPPAGGGTTPRRSPPSKPKTIVQPKPDLVQPRRDTEEE